MLTDSGAKLLDFGLAKLREAGVEAEVSRASALPTEERPLTEEGTILGTYPYMSPEQLDGKEADARTDIFAFGTVLYEMMTGKRAFEGKSRASLIAAIMSSEPRPIAELQPMAPPLLGRVVRRCLAKDPEERWQSANDLTDELKWIDEARAGSPAELLHPAHEPSRWRAIRTAMTALAGAVLGGLAVWGLLRPAPPASPPVTRFSITLPVGQRLGGPAHPLAISPDGTTLAYVAESDGQRQLYVHGLSELEARPILGTEGAANPFFSPDGQWVGFYAGNRLKKADIAGARVTDLCEAPVWLSGPWGGGSAWGTDGRIVSSWGGGATGGLMETSDQGGVAKPLVRSNENTESIVWPHLLPNQRELLFTISTVGGSELALLSLESNERRTLLRDARGPLQASCLRTGHLVYSEADRLFAAPFDLARYEVGAPKAVLEGIHTELLTGIGSTAAFALSASGTIAYVPGSTVAPSELVWVDRDGRTTPVNLEPAAFSYLSLSHDGTHAAVQVMKPGGSDIWLCDLRRGTRTPLTHRGTNQEPVWTPDGRWIIFSSGETLFRTRADGSGEIEELLTPDDLSFPSSLSPDGRVLAFYSVGTATQRDIYVMNMDGERTQQPILVDAASEHSPMFSPDGGLLAYVSDRSGRQEVYVQPYPGPGPRDQVSTEGGRAPMWSRSGRELFYRSGGRMMAVSVETGPRFGAGLPRVLFGGRFQMGQLGGQMYDVSPDGQRFLMIRSPQKQELTEIRVVLNWAEELKRLVPVN